MSLGRKCDLKCKKEENSWNGDQMVEFEELIHDYVSKLGNDIWKICERVIIAPQGMAWHCFDLQVLNFPGSHRDKQNLKPWKERTMFYYSHVIQFYKIQLIQEDPTTARKHKIDTQKALGEI